MFDGHELVYTYSDWQHSNHCLAPVTHWGPGPASAGGKVVSGPSLVTNPSFSLVVTNSLVGASYRSSEHIERETHRQAGESM